MLQTQETPAACQVDLLDALRHAWQSICDAYDVVADLPDIPALLEGADLSAPDSAAQTVVANMLLEALGHIPRFSPLAKRPLGLRREQPGAGGACVWSLSPETRNRWQRLLQPLAVAIEKNVGLLLAANLLDDVVDASGSARVLAICACVPPRVIKAGRAALAACDIVCDACQQPFRPVRAPGPDDPAFA